MIKIQLRINVKLFPVIIFKVTNEDIKIRIFTILQIL